MNLLKNKLQTLKVKYVEGIYYKVYYGHAVPGILELCVLAETMHSKQNRIRKKLHLCIQALMGTALIIMQK